MRDSTRVGNSRTAHEVPVVLTIGHSVRPLAELLDLLRVHSVLRLADVRAVPRSGRNPHFGREVLAQALEARGVEYVHLPELGGLRQPRPDSANRALRDEGFRGFADYMQTDRFEAALDRLIELARGSRLSLMCAEADPARCHRSLIADALSARGITVAHILDGRALVSHRMTRLARVEEGRVGYPALMESLPLEPP